MKAPPSMQRRHFQYIAEIIASSGQPAETRLWWAKRFAGALRATNSGFDTDRFLQAATKDR